MLLASCFLLEMFLVSGCSGWAGPSGVPAGRKLEVELAGKICVPPFNLLYVHRYLIGTMLGMWTKSLGR